MTKLCVLDTIKNKLTFNNNVYVIRNLMIIGNLLLVSYLNKLLILALGLCLYRPLFTV